MANGSHRMRCSPGEQRQPLRRVLRVPAACFAACVSECSTLPVREPAGVPAAAYQPYKLQLSEHSSFLSSRDGRLLDKCTRLRLRAKAFTPPPRRFRSCVHQLFVPHVRTHISCHRKQRRPAWAKYGRCWGSGAFRSAQCPLAHA